MADEQHDDETNREMKVTDRRMFTADGELRDEFRWVEDVEAVEEAAPSAGAAAAPPVPQPEPEASSPVVPEAAAGSDAAPAPGATPLDLPPTADSFGQPGFLDLLGVLAEPATIYLGDAPAPDGRTVEDLRVARLYIDLIALLRQRTAGNLNAQEQTVLDDLLYRLQMRYVEKRG